MIEWRLEPDELSLVADCLQHERDNLAREMTQHEEWRGTTVETILNNSRARLQKVEAYARSLLTKR